MSDATERVANDGGPAQVRPKRDVGKAQAADQPFEDPAHLVAAAEFLLEALYVNDRLSKYAVRGRTVFKR